MFWGYVVDSYHGEPIILKEAYPLAVVELHFCHDPLWSKAELVFINIKWLVLCVVPADGQRNPRWAARIVPKNDIIVPH